MLRSLYYCYDYIKPVLEKVIEDRPELSYLKEDK